MTTRGKCPYCGKYKKNIPVHIQNCWKHKEYVAKVAEETKDDA